MSGEYPDELLEQFPAYCPIGWRQGDPISLETTIRDKDGEALDWSGVYRIQVKRQRALNAELLGTLSGHGEVVGLTTRFTFTADANVSAEIPAGHWYYDAQQVGGITRLWGDVYVQPGVTG